MSLKEPFVVDLFDGRFFGAWTGEYKDRNDEQGKRPVIKPMGDGFISSLFPFIKKSKPFNYAIDPDKNVKTLDDFFGMDFKVMVPTEDVDNLIMGETIYGKIMGESDNELQEKREEVKQLRRENKRLENRIEKLQTTEEDKQRHESGNSNNKRKFGCRKDSCSKRLTRQGWKDNNFTCPKCGKKNRKLQKRFRN